MENIESKITRPNAKQWIPGIGLIFIGQAEEQKKPTILGSQGSLKENAVLMYHTLPLISLGASIGAGFAYLMTNYIE